MSGSFEPVGWSILEPSSEPGIDYNHYMRMRVPHEDQPEYASPLYSQATVDILRAQIETAEAANDRLSGMKFSDRMHAALVARAEAAEADAARYRWLREEAARFKGHDLFGSLVVSVTRLQRRSDNNGFTGLAVTPIGAEFDDEIDAAMARTKEETK